MNAARKKTASKKKVAKKKVAKKKAIAKKKKNGAPAWKPTLNDRDEIQAMSAAGMTRDEIAFVKNISEPTLAKHCVRELKLGKLIANQKVAATAFKMATGTMPPIESRIIDAETGKVTHYKQEDQRPVASIVKWWTLTQAGWRSDGGGNDGAARPSGVLAVPTVPEDEWLKVAEKQQRDLISSVSPKKTA